MIRLGAIPAALVAATLTLSASTLVRAEAPAEPGTARELSRAFKAAAQHVAPSVVSIRTKQVVRPSSPDGRQSGPFGGFFEQFMPPEQRQGMVRRGAGSGFVVDRDGHVLTNNHVVEDADEVVVAFSDGKELEAEVVATDPATDLAVLRVERDSLPPVVLGDSDALEVGDWVIAVGNPFGLEQTVTAGIVSATGRGALNLAAYGDFIQTDAAINPGNSGGPLLDLSGRVIGINSAITTRTGAWNGIGFAIPINLARDIMKSLIEDGRVARGYLGLMPQDLDEGLARSFGFDSTEGVLVTQVVPEQPADRAGFENEDIITAVDGRPVTSAEQLRNVIARYKPGSNVRVSVLRRGRGDELRERELRVELAERPERADEASSGEASGAEPERRLGFEAQSLSPELADRLGVDSARGAVITAVEPGSAADDAGLRPRDVIVSVDGQSVDDARALGRVLRGLDERPGVRLKVMRGENPFYVYLERAD